MPDTAVSEQIARIQDQKATWIPVEGEKPSPGQMVRVEVAPIEDGKVASRSRTISSSDRTRPFRIWRSDHVAAPHRECRRRGQVSRRPSGRGAPRTDSAGARDAARRKRQELPILDDAFAREAGDFENLDALKAAVRQDLEQEASREADAQVRQALLSQIIEANNVPAPGSLVHRLMHGYAEMYRCLRSSLSSSNSNSIRWPRRSSARPGA